LSPVNGIPHNQAGHDRKISRPQATWPKHLLMFSKIMQWLATVFSVQPASRWSASLHFLSDTQLANVSHYASLRQANKSQDEFCRASGALPFSGYRVTLNILWFPWQPGMPPTVKTDVQRPTYDSTIPPQETPDELSFSNN
jgi:hypothetical protein